MSMEIIKIPYVNVTGLVYWKYETSGKLQTTILKYLNAKSETDLSQNDRILLRSYFVHWAFCPLYKASPESAEFSAWQRRSQTLDSVAEFQAWLDEGIGYGVDPL
jgi:hypothetical protein